MTKFRKIISLLNKKERSKLLILVILMIIGALLETIGIGLVVPAISILIEGSSGILDYAILSSHRDSISKVTDAELTILIFLSLFFVFFLKTIFLIILYNLQYSFSSKVLERISKDFFTKIVNQPYSVFFKKNTSKYLNTLSNESRVFIDQCLEPLISVSTEIIIFIFIISFLIFIEPTGSLLIIGVLSVAIILFYFFSKGKTRFWGVQRQKHEEMLVKNIQETFQGIKEIKIFNIKNFIFKLFDKNLEESVIARKKINVLVQLPRVWLEIVAIFTLTLLIILSILFNKEIQTIFPIIALYAAAAFRIIPSANRMLIASQNLRYGFASVEKLCESFAEINELDKKNKLSVGNESKIQNFKSLEFKNISFSYEVPVKKIFNKVNFELNKGECIGIVGETGSGKSTLVDIICGLLNPSEGEIIINEKKVNQRQMNWNNLIGYVPQNYYLIDGTIKENIAFGVDKENINLDYIFNSLNRSQLTRFIDGLDKGIESQVGERGIKLSGGQKQRLAIARALYFDPEIVIFDESTSALDNETERNLIETIKNLKGKKTLIIISHRVSSLNFCDKIYEVKNLDIRKVS